MLSALYRVATWTLAAVATLYVLACIAAFTKQRALIYPVPPHPITPDCPNGTLLHIPGPDGVPVVALYLRANDDAPTVVHFHGNGEQLANEVWLARALSRRGVGYLAVEYPGYGLAGGAPSERALYDAAETALAYLRNTLGVPADRTVLQGQSLGTGVASEMALRGRGAALVLISPYSSMRDMAARVLPMLPTRLLLRDRYDTARKAPSITVPVLIVHGTDDELIPAAMGTELATLFPHARLDLVNGAHHNDLFARDGARLVERIVDFADRSAARVLQSPSRSNAGTP